MSHNALQSKVSASRLQRGASGERKTTEALARLHSARSFNHSHCFTAEGWGSSIAPLGLLSSGDWLLWFAFKLELNPRKIALAKSRCAATVAHLMRDARSKRAVEVVGHYGLGIASKQGLNAAAAADAAYADAAAAGAAAVAAAAARKYNQLETAIICREILGVDIIDAVNSLMI